MTENSLGMETAVKNSHGGHQLNATECNTFLDLFYCFSIIFFFNIKTPQNNEKQHLAWPKQLCAHCWVAKPGQKRTMNPTTLGRLRSQPPPRITRDSECLLTKQRSSFIITIPTTPNPLIQSISGNIKFPHTINTSCRVIQENSVLCYRIN